MERFLSVIFANEHMLSVKNLTLFDLGMSCSPLTDSDVYWVYYSVLSVDILNLVFMITNGYFMSYINQIWIHPMITPQLCIASIMYVTLFCIVFIFSLFHSHFLWMNYQLAPKLFYLFCTNFFCHVCKTPSVCFFSVLFCFLYYFFLINHWTINTHLSPFSYMHIFQLSIAFWLVFINTPQLFTRLR